jgi:ATP-dependent phosphofructokinase / diphosphate-dependent phosphofructokinase
MTSKNAIRRIAILTGGGDCPGINAVIRAVAKTAMYEHDLQVLGIEDGYQGLLENRIAELTPARVSGILTLGGTILGTNNKCNPTRVFVGNDAAGNPRFENHIDKCLANIESHQIDAIIAIGGDGSMSCTAPFVEAGIRCMGVPKTIDNDIVGTEITFGFTTAYTTATMSLDRLHTTAASHHRVMVCELMGRNSGWLALHAGVASGSDVILIPEMPYDLESICEFVKSRSARHVGFSIIAVAEGAKPIGGAPVVAKLDPTSADPVKLGGIGECIARDIERCTGLETRTTVLGHVVRGGGPVPADRVIATGFGCHAMSLLMSGASGRMVVMQNGELCDIDILDVANRQRLVPPDHPLIAAARAFRTCFGD